MSAHLPYHPHFSPYAGGRALAAVALALALIVTVLAIGTSVSRGGSEQPVAFKTIGLAIQPML
jgi:hypothetical protein